MAATDPDTNSCLSFQTRVSIPIPDSLEEDDGVQSNTHRVHHISDDNNVNDEDERGVSELNFSLNVRCLIPFKVKKTDTVKKLKAVCNRFGGVSKEHLDLFFAHHGLNDEQTFGEAMPTLCRNIYIRIPTHSEKNTSITAYVNDTVEMIKTKVMRKVDLEEQSHYFDLMYRGVYLEYHQTLESLSIENDSTFLLVERPLEAVRIFINVPNKRFPLTFQVKKINTIWEAKMIAGSVLGVNVEEAGLILKGHPDLNENRTFESLNILNMEYFTLVFPINVNVRLLTGDIITVNVLPSEQVCDLNKKVTEVMGNSSAVYHYFHGGERLLVGRLLHSYNITEGCTIAMGYSSRYPY